MTKIRLARFGSRHQPHYRIVVADSRVRRDGRFIEILGSYNPQAGTVKVDAERAEYWISVGAQPTNTTISLLTKGGVKHSFEVRKKPVKPVEEPAKEDAGQPAEAGEAAESTEDGNADSTSTSSEEVTEEQANASE